MAAAVAAHVYTFPDSQPMPLRKASADLKSIRGKLSTMRTTRKQLHIITCVSLCDLVGLRTGADELHYCWMSVHFESHKNLYSDRLEDEILQVVPDRARLHLHCGDTSTRTPRPLHYNVGFKRAPRVQADKIMQVNIEMWEGGFCRARKMYHSTWRLVDDNFHITCIILSSHCVRSSPAR